MRTIIVLLLVFEFAFLARAQRCAIVKLPALDAVKIGQVITFRNTVTNCGTKQGNFALKVVVDPPCSASITIWDADPADGKLAPGASYWQTPVYVPMDCTGSYQVFSSVRSGQTILATDKASFEVTE